MFREVRRHTSRKIAYGLERSGLRPAADAPIDLWLARDSRLLSQRNGLSINPFSRGSHYVEFHSSGRKSLSDTTPVRLLLLPHREKPLRAHPLMKPVDPRRHRSLQSGPQPKPVAHSGVYVQFGRSARLADLQVQLGKAL